MAGPSPRHSAWATQLRTNVPAVASRWRHCVRQKSFPRSIILSNQVDKILNTYSPLNIKSLRADTASNYLPNLCLVGTVASRFAASQQHDNIARFEFKSCPGLVATTTIKKFSSINFAETTHSESNSSVFYFPTANTMKYDNMKEILQQYKKGKRQQND